MSDIKTEVRETSADIKKKIEQMNKEVRESARPLTGMAANEVNANSTPGDNAIQTEIKPDQLPAAAKSVEGAKTTEDNVDYKAWAKKRGIEWTTDDSILAALRKSDQEFHKRQAEKKAQEKANPPYIPPVGMSSPPQYQPPAYQPQYQVQQQPVNDNVLIQNVARDYNLTVQDAEKLLRFNRDFYQVAINQERQRFNAEINSMKRENEKNSVFRELSSDPVFKRPDVAMEYHRVLEDLQDKNPEAFEQDPATYRRAYDITLQNIGRRVLEGQPLQEGVPFSQPGSFLTPPLNPPQPLGKSSGGGALENEQGIDPKAFAQLPLEEKAKVLARMGLRSAS